MKEMFGCHSVPRTTPECHFGSTGCRALIVCGSKEIRFLCVQMQIILKYKVESVFFFYFSYFAEVRIFPLPQEIFNLRTKLRTMLFQSNIFKFRFSQWFNQKLLFYALKKFWQYRKNKHFQYKCLDKFPTNSQHWITKMPNMSNTKKQTKKRTFHRLRTQVTILVNWLFYACFNGSPTL